MTHEEAKAYRYRLNLDKERFSDFCSNVIDIFEERKMKLIKECPHEELLDNICKVCQRDLDIPLEDYE
jgi:hypothetical protein